MIVEASMAWLLVTSVAWDVAQGDVSSPNSTSCRVYRVDGNPAAGATYYLINRTEIKGDFVAEKGTTDSRGDFVPKHRFAKGEDTKFLVVRCEGQGLYFRFLEGKGLPREVHLNPATKARVQLVLPNGSPAQNVVVVPTALVAPVKNSRPDYLFFSRDLGLEFAVRTDSAGQCAIDGMPSGDTLNLDVNDDRFVHLANTGSIELGDTKDAVRRVKLVQAASISGRLTRGGVPVPGVAINADAVGTQGWGNGTTDARGVFKLTRLGSGAYNVGLDLRPPMSDDWTGRAKEVIVKPGELKTGISLTVEKGSVVAGCVFDNMGKPVSGVDVGIYGPARPHTGSWVQSAQTDKRGAYRMRVPSGEQYIYVMNGIGGPSKTVTVGDLKQVTVDFKIPAPKKEVSILGHVQNDAKEPIPGAVVDVRFEGQDPTLDEPKVTSDSMGNFSFVMPPEASSVSILAHTDLLSTADDIVPSQGHVAIITLKPHQLARGFGTVVDPNGKPIEGASIQVILWHSDHGSDYDCVKTGKDGRFVVNKLYPNHKYSFTAKVPGFSEASVDFLTPLPDETVDLKQFRLLAADAYLGGLVKDVHGNPVVGAYVGVIGQSIPPTTTDSSGRFRIEGVSRGTHSIYVNKGEQYINSELIASKEGQIVVLKPQNQPVQSDEVVPLESPSTGGKAAEIESGVWLNSRPLSLSKLHGKIVLMDFWGLTCRPCVAALPSLEGIAKRFGSRSVVVIGINDSTDKPKQVARLAKKSGLTYPLTIDRKAMPNQFGKTAAKFHVGATPTLVLIDQDGKVVAQPDSPERAVEMIIHLLRKRP